MTSEELSEKVEPTIGAVIYHLKKLMKAGLVVKMDSEYMLRMSSLSATIEEIQKEINLSLDNINDVAGFVDEFLEK